MTMTDRTALKPNNSAATIRRSIRCQRQRQSHLQGHHDESTMTTSATTARTNTTAPKSRGRNIEFAYQRFCSHMSCEDAAPRHGSQWCIEVWCPTMRKSECWTILRWPPRSSSAQHNLKECRWSWVQATMATISHCSNDDNQLDRSTQQQQ